MEIYIAAAVVIVAFLYSSIGHGGASGYIAVMALFSVPAFYIKPSALILNLFVAGIAFLMFYRAGYFKLKKLLPFAITSIPFAFLGGLMEINAHVYKIILGVFLLVAISRMFFIPKEKLSISDNPPFTVALFIGAGLGFISGLIGIGGGILLSPILIVFGWATLKEAAAVSAVFIFLNSASGLGGLIVNGIDIHSSLYLFIFAGMIGALAGSYEGSFKFNTVQLRSVLAIVLILACFKLFFN
ncbi:MAG: hypothetical protein A2W91_13265 [Bacteroidetes bacterium GWF2_38_335]|nr:MAG: hypothetical protein A2W91_13265 [Bacteroidetes bacterium GWF2_38_335]OFY77224.1 MAG: hypothetical protein A2281_14930 [Bacteroidetes bacterium RIFOXYA12_FULL_38_20]HBS85775.1 hypothetical protein [Bacteroidales bacterium]